MREKAKTLYDEYKKDFVFFSRWQKSGFIRRLKNLAGKIDVSENSNLDHRQAAMYLDHLALWLSLDLKYKGL